MKKIVALLLALTMAACMFASCTPSVPTSPTIVDLVGTQGTTAGTTAGTTEGTQSTAQSTTQATTTPQNPGTNAGYPASPQAAGAPTETAGKGPFLWLDFEENNIKDGVIDNIAGEGLDAKITGKPEYVTSPTGGSAIYFGNGDTFDYLTIENNEKLNFGVGDDFTIDFWYMIEKTNSTWENLFSKGKSKNGWYGVWLSTDNSASGGICWGGDTGNKQIASKYVKKKWQHVTIIKKSGTLILYLNGELIKTLNAPNYVSDTNLYIGGMNSSYENAGTAQSTVLQGQFHGAIDDFKIYDYAWATEVKTKPINSAKAFTYNFTNANNQKINLPYRVYFPTDYETSGKDYPVLLFLHGHGECGTDNCNQLQVFGANLFLDEIAEMDNCIIVAPQTYCDGATNYSEWVASGAGVSSGHVWDRGMPIRPGTLDDTIHTLGMQAAEALIKEFIQNNRVDENRVYVGGISMGGCGTWEIIARNPELFAAAVPLCGSGILSTAPTLTGIDIWAFHGTADPTVLPEGTAKMAEAIQAAGGTKIIYTALAGKGHSIWNDAYTTKNAAGQTPAQWILQQTKAD